MPYLIVLLVVVVIVMISCVNVVPQAHAYVVERLGGYQATWRCRNPFQSSVY